MINKDVDAAVGMSRLWDARKAGREVARQAIKDLKQPPSFFVLFSTIHYKDHGGFEQLLAGVWEVLPKGTPLVGGTVAGFMNNFGCYTHGCTALAVCCEQMDVVVGVGRNTKRNPKRAARQCARMIQSGLQHSKYDNKFLLNFISSSEIPDIPILGRKKIYTKGLSTSLLLRLFGFSQFFLQKGVGRDDEVIENMTKYMPDFFMLGGGTLDDGENLNNFQFFNNKIMKNSIVSIGLKTNINLNVLTTHNMKETGIKFKITKVSRDGRVIHKINNKPALNEILNLLDWPKDFLNEENWYKTTYFFPMGFRININRPEIGPRVIGGIFGQSLATVIRSKDDQGSFLTIDGANLLKTISQNLNSFPKEPSFGLISSCSTRLITMGNKIYMARNQVLDFFNDSPFIVFYVGGESTYSPKKGLNYVNMSFNSAIFWND
jgi:hypothetical protein